MAAAMVADSEDAVTKALTNHEMIGLVSREVLEKLLLQKIEGREQLSRGDLLATPEMQSAIPNLQKGVSFAAIARADVFAARQVDRHAQNGHGRVRSTSISKQQGFVGSTCLALCRPPFVPDAVMQGDLFNATRGLAYRAERLHQPTALATRASAPAAPAAPMNGKA